MFGVFVGDMYLPVQQPIEELLLLVEYRAEHEWEGQGRYLPLSGQITRRFFRPL
jgi:hypothetical protein